MSSKIIPLYSHIKGAFGGSGSAAMSRPEIQQRILRMVGKSPLSDILVVYLGTATYDDARAQSLQTATFVAQGARVVPLPISFRPPTEQEAQALDSADVIMVSGGNTLFAVDRWKACGLDAAIRRAAARGAVLAGGSAGAICWFDGGHSDSMDPSTYWRPGLAAEGGVSGAEGGDVARRDWAYVRVDGVGVLPGLVCPHHDMTQSNGVPRAEDFAGMVRRHSGELGLGIDHWAVWFVEGGEYEVVSVEKGSGVWVREMHGDELRTEALPASGLLQDVLRPAIEIQQDPRLAQARIENPSSF